MKKILALCLGSSALVLGLSSCTYDNAGDLRYGQTGSDTASIWNRAARYGYGQPSNPPRAMRYDPSGYVYQSPNYPYGGYTNTTGNRYGAGAYGDGNNQQYQFDQPARLSGTVSGAEREMRRQRELQAQLDRQEWEDQQRKFREQAQQRDGNVVAESSPLRREVPRFNPSNQDRPVSGELPQMSTRNSGSDSLASSSKPNNSGGNNSTSTQSSAKKETPASLPFAVPVPGKTGYVTLPAPNNNLPEIDVRGIAPGTPVEIPDPNRAGKTIQFKVP